MYSKFEATLNTPAFHPSVEVGTFCTPMKWTLSSSYRRIDWPLISIAMIGQSVSTGVTPGTHSIGSPYKAVIVRGVNGRMNAPAAGTSTAVPPMVGAPG